MSFCVSPRLSSLNCASSSQDCQGEDDLFGETPQMVVADCDADSVVDAESARVVLFRLSRKFVCLPWSNFSLCVPLHREMYHFVGAFCHLGAHVQAGSYQASMPMWSFRRAGSSELTEVVSPTANRSLGSNLPAKGPLSKNTAAQAP